MSFRGLRPTVKARVDVCRMKGREIFDTMEPERHPRLFAVLTLELLKLGASKASLVVRLSYYLETGLAACNT